MLNSTEQRLVNAATEGGIEVVDSIINNQNHEVTKIGVERAFLAASKEGKVRVVQFLLERRVDIDMEVISPKEGGTALHLASAAGHAEVVEYLVTKMADVDCLSKVRHAKYGVERQTALFWAAQEGHVEVVKVLLKAGADIKMKCGESKESILHKAAYMGRERMVEFLLDLSDDPSADIAYTTTDGQSALHLAAYSPVDAEEVAELLLANGADVNLESSFARSPLNCAALCGSEGVCGALLRGGADISHRCSEGYTPLACSIRYAKVGAVKVLLKNGADPNEELMNGVFLLHMACGFYSWPQINPVIVRLLLDHGANPNAPLSDGDRPLHLAVRVGSTEAVSHLLAYNACPLMKNEENLSPIDVVMNASNDNAAIVIRLLQVALFAGGG